MKKLLQGMLFGAAIAALASTASAETKVQLVEVITSPQRTEFLRKELDEFEKANPDITAKIETAIRQNSGLIAEQILAGSPERDADGEEPAEE